MKKISLTVMLVFILSVMSAGWSMAGTNDTLQTIKKAVSKNPAFEKGREVKWFKVLIQEDGRDKVKITLPIALIEVFVKHSHSPHLNVDMGDSDINLRELFHDLKNLGPMAMIEIMDEGELIKVWLE